MSNNEAYMNDCKKCALYRYCLRRQDETQRSECPLLQEKEEKFGYRNQEGYADPTAYYAVRHVDRKEKRRKYPRTMVVHYD